MRCTCIAIELAGEGLSDLPAPINIPLEDTGFFILPLNHGATFCFEPGFYRNPHNEAESERVARLFLETRSQLIQNGAFFDRPYPLWAEEVYR